MLFKLLGVCVILCLWTSGTDGQSSSGYPLPREPTYFITAPAKIHPNMVVQVQVNILKLDHKHINVRASIRREKEEIAQSFTKFEREGSLMVQMEIPDNAADGDYTLRVEGSINGGIGGFVFENETSLIFELKQCSVFIQTSKPHYRQGQKVLFRVMPVETNLMSRSGSMDVYMVDATDTVVRRWLSMQTNAGGVLDMELQLVDQPAFGVWKIQVQAFGSIYEKSFEVTEFWVTAIDVNVSMPLHYMEDHFAIAGVISANLSLGQPVKGTCKTKLEVRLPLNEREPGKEYQWPTIETEPRYFPGVTDFFFRMEDIARLIGRDSVRGYEIFVEAEVFDWFLVQSATGSAITVVYGNDVELRLLGDRSRTFKPGMPVDVYFAAEHHDKTPLMRPRRQVTVKRTETRDSGVDSVPEDVLLVRDDGICHYQFIPKEDTSRIRIVAYYDKEMSKQVEVRFSRNYSPTQSYIFIESSTTAPYVDEYMVFTVKTNTFVNFVYYVISATGNIVTGGVLDMQSMQKTFSVSLSRDMMPQARMVAWYIYDSEVIADSRNFFVNGTTLNPVNVTFNRGKDFTGDNIELTGSTDPGAYVGFSGVDYELWERGGNPFITEIDIIRELETYDSHANVSFQHHWKLPENQDQLVHFPAPSYAIDANTTFSFSGLIVFTDANVTRIPHPCNESTGNFPCFLDQQCYTWDQRCDTVWNCWDGADEMGCKTETQDPYTTPWNRLSKLTRHFNELGDWLWTGYFVKPDGRLDLKVSVPDEPMAWVSSAFSISKDKGFGILNHPARHQATRMFYMRAEAPDTARKGEQIGVRISLFNYWDQDLECLVTLHDSNDYRFVIVEDYGIVSSYNPRTIRGSIQTMVYLEKGGVYEKQIPILPVKDGCVTVTVTGATFIYSDTESVQICTTYDGVNNYLHTPFLIDLVSQGSMVLPDLEIPVPERFIKPQQREHLYVPGSQTAHVGIVGDVVGPGFISPVLDAEMTLMKPYGSADQNIYNLAVNLYNLKYLKVTNQLPDNVLSQALEGMNMALQRQMGYFNGTAGYFSMFRDYQKPTPSVWGTAFILRVLNYANDKDWEYDFFIDVELLNRMMLWLCDQRDFTSGAFYNIGPMYDRKMQDNMTLDNAGNRVPSNISITAYVLITLASTDRVTGAAEHCKNQARVKAMEYIELNMQNLTDPFQTALVTYALHRAGSIKSTEAFQKLESMKRTTEFTYWANKVVPPNEIKMIDNIPYHQPRKWYDNEGHAVHATSYGLLTYLRRFYLRDSTPIMKWLQTMRNTYSAHASTQDSIVALEALTEYAKQDTNRALYNIQVDVDATSMGNWTRRVRLDRSNWQVQQEIQIPKVWGSVRGRAQGTGLAMMQLATSVNVEYPHQIEPRPPEGVQYFDVGIEHYQFSGKNFSIMNITACAKWVRPDIAPRSGMAVLEFDHPTGYKITNDVLRSYAQSGRVPTLRRAEAYNRKIVFYFDYIDNITKTCVNVRLDRWFPVANMTIQHKLRVFDYYEPGMHNTTLYTTWELHNLHLCQVCASFQCPYCPFYNAATAVHVSVVFSLLTTAWAYLICRFLLIT